MEQRISERYDDRIFHRIRERYGIPEENIRLLDGFESFIYEYTLDGEPRILRVGHTFRRTREHFLGEVDWLHFLEGRGGDVAAPVKSPSGNFIEEFDDGLGENFIVAAFKRAPGAPPKLSELPEDFPVSYGAVIGRLHRLTKEYSPSRPEWRRDEWEHQSKREVEPWVARDPEILSRYRELTERILTLPKDGDSYGLIHQDAHMGNFFVDGDRITLFDFDDCVYSWFAYDIAMVVFYRFVNRNPSKEDISRFLELFLRGYRSENRFQKQWMRSIPDFLTLREIDLYAILHRSFDPENWPSEWVETFMNGRRERILDALPIFTFDWDDFDGENFDN